MKGLLYKMDSSWWRHQMETFSALLGLCTGNSPVAGEFPPPRPVTGSFDVFFDLSLNKRLSKQSWGWWFETSMHPLWRHCNDFLILSIIMIKQNLTNCMPIFKYICRTTLFKSTNPVHTSFSLAIDSLSAMWYLTHWGWMMHICVSKLTIIGSDNGLWPGRRRAIIWTNAWILIIRALGTNSSEIPSEIFIQGNAFENVVCQMTARLSGHQWVKEEAQSGNNGFPFSPAFSHFHWH